MAAESETISLIGSDKVQGTAVYSADGEKIGSIERVMIEKVNGKVSYAVLSFGGFLGIGDDRYPLPWPSLKYNVELGGYQTLVPIEKISGAPKYAHSGRAYRRAANGRSDRGIPGVDRRLGHHAPATHAARQRRSRYSDRRQWRR